MFSSKRGWKHQSDEIAWLRDVLKRAERDDFELREYERRTKQSHPLLTEALR